MNCVDTKPIFKLVPLYCVCVYTHIYVYISNSNHKDRNFQNIPFIIIIKWPTE